VVIEFKRILICLQEIDKFLIISEKEQDAAFIKHITEQLNEAKAPGRITKTQYCIALYVYANFYNFFNIFLMDHSRISLSLTCLLEVKNMV